MVATKILKDTKVVKRPIRPAPEYIEVPNAPPPPRVSPKLPPRPEVSPYSNAQSNLHSSISGEVAEDMKNMRISPGPLEKHDSVSSDKAKRSMSDDLARSVQEIQEFWKDDDNNGPGNTSKLINKLAKMKMENSGREEINVNSASFLTTGQTIDFDISTRAKINKVADEVESMRLNSDETTPTTKAESDKMSKAASGSNKVFEFSGSSDVNRKATGSKVKVNSASLRKRKNLRRSNKGDHSPPEQPSATRIFNLKTPVFSQSSPSEPPSVAMPAFGISPVVNTHQRKSVSPDKTKKVSFDATVFQKSVPSPPSVRSPGSDAMSIDGDEEESPTSNSQQQRAQTAMNQVPLAAYGKGSQVAFGTKLKTRATLFRTDQMSSLVLNFLLLKRLQKCLVKQIQIIMEFSSSVGRQSQMLMLA